MMMRTPGFKLGEVHSMQPDAEYDTGRQQEQWIAIAGGLSVLFAAVAGVLILLARRRPSRLQRAEAALVAAAERAEEAARTVRKRGPGALERGARRTEDLARTIRKQGPAVVVRGGERVERFGRAIRKQGPSMLVRTADRMEQVARAVRKQGPGMVAQSAG